MSQQAPDRRSARTYTVLGSARPVHRGRGRGPAAPALPGARLERDSSGRFAGTELSGTSTAPRAHGTAVSAHDSRARTRAPAGTARLTPDGRHHCASQARSTPCGTRRTAARARATGR